MTYDLLSDVYDRFTDDFDYDAWTKWYLYLVGLVAPGAKDICECGCGTGSVSVRMAKKGYRITGIDLSEDMLRVASDKARAWGVKIRFARQDMRALALPKPVDAIVCPCDCVNYLTDDRSLNAFLARAFESLKSGGALAFDISNREKLLKMGADGLYADDRENETYLWMNEYDEKTGTLRMKLTFFVRETDGRYRRFEETHIQRVYRTEELVNALSRAGFSEIRVFGGDEGESEGPGGKRVYLLARKP